MNNKGNSKAKRVLAMIGIILLLGLYAATLVTAILAKPYSHGMFLACIYASCIVPIFIYGFLLVTRTMGRKKDDGSMSITDLHKMKKQMKEMPDDSEEDMPVEDSFVEETIDKK